MKLNFKSNEGFTLVELLASIVVLVAVGSVVAGIITASLRGANKTNVMENIRENGNYALTQISRSIEYAQVFNGLSDNGEDYTMNCPFSASPTPSPVETQYSFIKVTSSNDNATEYGCTVSAPATITSNGASLINTSSIVMTDCVIACVQTRATDIPVVKIGFKLGPKDPTGIAETSSPPILFETSITIRNYKK